MSNSDRYNYAFDPGSQAWAARLLRQVPEGASVLELGPGPGAMTQVLLDRGHAVTVVENDPESIAVLKSKGAEVLVGDLNAGEWCRALEGRQFGALLACDVLEHLHDPSSTLKALLGLAAPAGRLVVSMPNVSYAGLVAALRLGQFDYSEKGLLDRTHMRFFTRSSLAKTLMACGWAPELWEGNHVPIEQSEFVWAWQQLGDVQRQCLISGWAEFDVYQWMTIATPMTDAVTSRIQFSDEEVRHLRETLHELTCRHQQEHASLIEHQKAFEDAKAAIAGLEAQVANHGAALATLEQERRAAVSGMADMGQQLVAKSAEAERLMAHLEGLRAQGWPGRLRRLFDTLRK